RIHESPTGKNGCLSVGGLKRQTIISMLPSEPISCVEVAFHIDTIKEDHERSTEIGGRMGLLFAACNGGTGLRLWQQVEESLSRSKQSFGSLWSNWQCRCDDLP